MTMQRQGSAQFVSAEEHQQLASSTGRAPSIVSVLEKHFDLQQYLLGGKGSPASAPDLCFPPA